MLHKDGIFFALLLTFASTEQFVSIIHYNEVNTFSLYKELNIDKYAQPSPPSYIGRVQNLKTGVAGPIPGSGNFSQGLLVRFPERQICLLGLIMVFMTGFNSLSPFFSTMARWESSQ